MYSQHIQNFMIILRAVCELYELKVRVPHVAKCLVAGDLHLVRPALVCACVSENCFANLSW